MWSKDGWRSKGGMTAHFIDGIHRLLLLKKSREEAIDRPVNNNYY